MILAADFQRDEFFDRRPERTLFEHMITGETDKRVLAIHDGENMGKTQLLRALQAMCSDHEVPVAYVDPETLAEPKPIDLALKLVSQLPDVGFPRFTQMEILRSDGDFEAIVASDHVGDREAASMWLQGANLSGADKPKIAQRMMVVEEGGHVIVPPSERAPELSQGQQRIARAASMTAFAKDLREAADRRVIAILIDTYEAYADEIRTWFEGFLKDQVVVHKDGPPRRLSVAIAGRHAPPFEVWKKARVDAHVELRRLGPWTVDDFDEALRRFGLEYPSDKVEMLFEWIGDTPPKELVGMIKLMAQRAGTWP